MATLTSTHGLPYPAASETPDVPRDILALVNALDAAWTAYTPTLAGTGFALGNGTLVAAYRRYGTLVAFRSRLTFGSTTTMGTTGQSQTLPVGALGAASSMGLHLHLNHTGTVYRGLSWCNTTNAPMFSTGTNGVATTLTATVPFTWATNDIIDLSGVYEAS